MLSYTHHRQQSLIHSTSSDCGRQDTTVWNLLRSDHRYSTYIHMCIIERVLNRYKLYKHKHHCEMYVLKYLKDIRMLHSSDAGCNSLFGKHHYTGEFQSEN